MISTAKRLRELIDYYGISAAELSKGVRFHDLRHFCASWLHAQNVPEEYILERGGWSTANVMKAVYRHALASEEDRISKGIVDKVNETFLDVM